MRYNSLIPELSVADIVRTKHFYIDILGFRICYEREENRFVFVTLEDNQMMLEQINGQWNTGKLEYPFGRGINFEMSVSDVDSIYKRIIEAGINPFAEMESVTYRTGESELTQKQFLVLDPDGYLLRFVEG